MKRIVPSLIMFPDKYFLPLTNIFALGTWWWVWEWLEFIFPLKIFCKQKKQQPGNKLRRLSPCSVFFRVVDWSLRFWSRAMVMEPVCCHLGNEFSLNFIKLSMFDLRLGMMHEFRILLHFMLWTLQNICCSNHIKTNRRSKEWNKKT